MLEKILGAYISDYLQIPVWTLLLATACLAWLLYSGRSAINIKKSFKTHDIPSSPKTVKSEEVADLPNGFTRKKKRNIPKKKLKVFYGTSGGQAKVCAEQLVEEAYEKGYEAAIEDMKSYDPEDNLSEESAKKNICIIIISTYTDGHPPEGVEWFYKWLQDAASDFRVQKTLLKDLEYSVFGLGNSAYKDYFNNVGRNIDTWLGNLSAARVISLGIGDENSAESEHGGIAGDFAAWRKSFWRKVKPILAGRKSAGDGCSDGGACNKQCKCQEDGHKCSSEEESSGSDLEADDHKHTAVMDLEDLGKVLKKTEEQANESSTSDGPKEMITPLLQKSLQKQGYRLIGSHSGVKLCRWTKSMLRGRGGCYKHTFYGIESHRCMETTPSLACANKSITQNPVGTEWRWKMDDAQTVFDGAVQNHLNMIKQYKGNIAQFLVDGQWWTWIDYNKFHQLIGQPKGATFTAEDYMAKTPDWAVYGASERGFDPVESRFYRKKQKINVTNANSSNS
ncbi:hypothetical protein ScPMuIL_005913 [Solemya velum]